MKENDAIIKGVTLSAVNGRTNQLLVTMAVSEAENRATGEKKIFSMPKVVTLSIEPYRSLIPLNDKCALVARGSEAEFRISGPDDELKVEFVRAQERHNVLSLQEFMASRRKSAETEAILRGVTLSAVIGRYDQLKVTMAVGEIVSGANGEAETFVMPPMVMLSLEPYRLVIPLNDKCALVARGSEAEFRISGPENEPKPEFVKAKEFKKALSLEEFWALLHKAE